MPRHILYMQIFTATGIIYLSRRDLWCKFGIPERPWKGRLRLGVAFRLHGIRQTRVRRSSRAKQMKYLQISRTFARRSCDRPVRLLVKMSSELEKLTTQECKSLCPMNSMNFLESTQNYSDNHKITAAV